MGVTDVELLAKGGAESDVETALRSTHVYLVTCSKVSDGPEAAHDAEGIPDNGDAHETAENLFVRNKRVEYYGDRLHFHVYVFFATPTHRKLEDDPLDDRVQISWGTWTRVEALWFDKDGTILVNKAEDPFDPPLEHDVYESTVRIIRNEATFTPATAQSYKGSVNSDSTTIAGLAVTARQAKLTEWAADSSERNGIEYWRIAYEIMFHGNFTAGAGTLIGWDRSAVNQGLHIKSVSIPKARCQVKDQAGNLADAMTPQLLDAAGAQLAIGGTPVLLAWRATAEKTFASLGLNI